MKIFIKLVCLTSLVGVLLQPASADHIPSAQKMLETWEEVPQKQIGDMAISTLGEFYKAFGSVLERELVERPYLKSYITAYYQVTELEITKLKSLDSFDSLIFGIMFVESGILYEFVAYDSLLHDLTDTVGKKDKDKKGGEGLAKELKDIKSNLPEPPWWLKWIETILESIIDIFA